MTDKLEAKKDPNLSRLGKVEMCKESQKHAMPATWWHIHSDVIYQGSQSPHCVVGTASSSASSSSTVIHTVISCPFVLIFCGGGELTN